jgi:hypothetical protein
MWPAFVVLTVLEAVLLHLRPVAGDGIGVVPAFLLCGFLNLAVVAFAAPVSGWLVRRRRPSLPRDVATDRAGTALLLALAATLGTLGALHHDVVVERDRAFEAQAAAVRAYVRAHAPAAYRVNLERADTWVQAPDLFRTCVPGPDPHKALCLIVETGRGPPRLVVDPDQQPNARIAGPDNPGRRRG